MTLAQIILRAIHLLDEEPEDVGEFHDLFMAFANEGYRIAVTQYVRPRQRFPVKTDKGGFAPLLFAHVTRVVRLEDGTHAALRLNSFRNEQNTSGHLTIEYAYPLEEALAIY